MSKSQENLKEAFAGNQQANRKYLPLRRRRMRKALPGCEAVPRRGGGGNRPCHNHLRQMGGIRSTKENLEEAVSGEVFEFQKMYRRCSLLRKAREIKGGKDFPSRERGGEDPRRPLPEGRGRPGQERGDRLLRVSGVRKYRGGDAARQVSHLRLLRSPCSRRWIDRKKAHVAPSAGAGIQQKKPA